MERLTWGQRVKLHNVGENEYMEGLEGHVLEDTGGIDVRVMFDIGETCYVLRDALTAI